MEVEEDEMERAFGIDPPPAGPRAETFPRGNPCWYKDVRSLLALTLEGHTLWGIFTALCCSGHPSGV